tara:strand:+ start:708 stop:971 length:264 start_codon:yes stop_codon:yes gene_type:complete
MGLSVLQSIVEFSGLSDDIEININIAEEEESHNTINYETKTIKEKQDSKFDRNDYYDKVLVATAAIIKDFLYLHQGFYEIFSPPPKV